MSEEKEMITIIVTAPVAIRMTMSREDAEEMYLDELAELIDCVLEDCKKKRMGLCAQTEAMRSVPIDYDIEPSWDRMPEDDVQLVSTEDGLFPTRKDDDEDEK